MATKSKPKLACSALTGAVYLGDRAHDVTDDAVGAVAQSLLVRKVRAGFEWGGKRYVLQVVAAPEAAEN